MANDKLIETIQNAQAVADNEYTLTNEDYDRIDAHTSERLMAIEGKDL